MIPIGMALTYLVAQALYKKIAVSELPLTALVPSAIAHSHPLFVDTVRILGPKADALEKKIENLTEQVKARLKNNLKLLTFLETADNVVYDPDSSKLVIGANELESQKAELYYSFWKINSVVRHLIALATKNTADSPQEFFKHVTFAVSQNVIKKAQVEFDTAENVITAFLRADGATDKACGGEK